MGFVTCCGDLWLLIYTQRYFEIVDRPVSAARSLLQAGAHPFAAVWAFVPLSGEEAGNRQSVSLTAHRSSLVSRDAVQRGAYDFLGQPRRCRTGRQSWPQADDGVDPREAELRERGIRVVGYREDGDGSYGFRWREHVEPAYCSSMPGRTLTSSQPILHCCDTWHALAAAGTILANRPTQPETWAAIRKMHDELLLPLEERFGMIDITYGFAGPELVKAIRKRAAEGGWHPNIHPPSDQHACHELNTRGTRICKVDGFAVDLRVPGVLSDVVSDWVRANLPFDAIYLYAPERPFHLSWSPTPRGTVIRMVPWKDGRLIPRTVVRGRMTAAAK